MVLSFTCLFLELRSGSLSEAFDSRSSCLRRFGDRVRVFDFVSFFLSCCSFTSGPKKEHMFLLCTVSFCEICRLEDANNRNLCLSSIVLSYTWSKKVDRRGVVRVLSSLD